MNLFYCDAMQKHYMSNINSIKFSLILVEKLILKCLLFWKEILMHHSFNYLL